MSILSGAIGTMKKKAVNMEQYQVSGTFNSKTYWVTGKSAEPVSKLEWGSNTKYRGTISTTDGLSNSITLAGLGSSANNGHPAAHYCRSLTLGGYSWFLPAKDELNHIYTNLTASGKLLAAGGTHVSKFYDDWYWSSTEINGSYASKQYMTGGQQNNSETKDRLNRVRACRTV